MTTSGMLSAASEKLAVSSFEERTGIFRRGTRHAIVGPTSFVYPFSFPTASANRSVSKYGQNTSQTERTMLNAVSSQG